ncbi:MAG: Na/Pi cotransporter family protein [Xanthomonadales bacterium]|jgi:phosphate:Na+ symporter|nr:Na/Pi cotransporter family protein [Xanthomonadales bacterium]MDH3923512.1 Na/Pi cotransporter family protein [Xanthomonadales bacterium]MDH3940052.1 Na/Pi cotransporter family protein [Xanthomonadales bacterium]MDH4001870.1 Na/Pi cotransporter family protein [Xanthomonadales bacterium]
MDSPLASFGLWAGLFGGLALFLFGMDVMTQALKSAAGDYMKDILGKLTRNRFVGVGVGAFVTAIIQSSSVTTVILVGFISAGLMSMSQSVAVIIGANIGTTITAQILAFKVTKIALPIIAGGFLLSATAKSNQWKQVGMILLGLGLVFYGMSIMSGALNPLRSYEPFVQFMISMQNPLLGAAVGALFTAVVQSSSATTGILIVMASQGLIGLESAIAIALGANIGTCVTAGLASIGKPREAVRAAVVHTLFNVAGVLLWIGFIPQLAQLAYWISPTAQGLTGTALLAAETPRQIANIHTFFNIANAFLFVGFTTQIARLVEWLIPDRPLKPQKAMLPKYLDDDLLDNPSIALEAVRNELKRMGKRVRKMVMDIMPIAISGTREDLDRIAEMDKVVDALHHSIIEYLGQISLANLSNRQSKELLQLVEIANALEQIGDRIATGMVTSANKRIDENVVVSAETARVLNDYHAMVVTALKDALKAVSTQNSTLAKQVRQSKKEFTSRSRDLIAHGLDRLTADEPNRLNTYAREMEIMELLDIVFAIARRIARTQG